MRKIIPLLSGDAETVLGPAGLGDFVATGFSRFSKNHQVGAELAVGRLTNGQSEGLVSLSSLLILLGPKYKKFPLLAALSAVVAGDEEAGVAFDKLLFDWN